MQKGVLKLLSVVLCGLLIYNSLGYFFVFSAIKTSLRHQKWATLARIPDSELTYFRFSKTTLNPDLKIINSREILVNGSLYDVVRKKVTADIVEYFCVYDKDEEKLIARVRQVNTTSYPAPLKNTSRIILEQIIKNAVCADPITTQTVIISAKLGLIVGEIYTTPSLSILSPPPKNQT